MDWTRHRGGLHRADDGHVVKRLDANTFAIWRPGASIDDEPLATFASLDQARAYAEDGELVTASSEPTPRKDRGKKGSTVSEGTKHAEGTIRGNTVEARLERTARAAEAQGLQGFADECRALIASGKQPAKAWTKRLRSTLPDEVDEDQGKAAKIAFRLAGRFEQGHEPEVLLKKVYADAYYLERA